MPSRPQDLEFPLEVVIRGAQQGNGWEDDIVHERGHNGREGGGESVVGLVFLLVVRMSPDISLNFLSFFFFFFFFSCGKMFEKGVWDMYIYIFLLGVGIGESANGYL